MTEAKQGHKYAWNGLEVLAMESGPYPECQQITGAYGWPLRALGRIDAELLEPLPMAYFSGQVPQ
jgi:hypothetical protein